MAGVASVRSGHVSSGEKSRAWFGTVRCAEARLGQAGHGQVGSGKAR